MKNRELLKIVSWVGLLLVAIVFVFVDANSMILPGIGMIYALLYAYRKMENKTILTVGSLFFALTYLAIISSPAGLLDVILWATIFYLTYKS